MYVKLSFFFLILTLPFLSDAQEQPEGLFINSRAADFKASDQYGNEIRLKDVLRDSLVVLVFYRGQWCPYCNRHLKKLEDSLQLITAKGAKLIAVTPEKPEFIDMTMEKTGATYSILYDKDMKIMKSYDVAFEVDERTVARYKRSDIDLADVNGQKDKAYLPVPAVYIINKEATVTYRYFDENYRRRVSVKEILENIR